MLMKQKQRWRQQQQPVEQQLVEQLRLVGRKYEQQLQLDVEMPNHIHKHIVANLLRGCDVRRVG